VSAYDTLDRRGDGVTNLYFGPWYRRSPYFEATRRYGCRAYDVYNHMLLPAEYGDPVEEYRHLVEHVTLWDVAVERIVEIAGPDALEFTNRLTPRDLTRCSPGQCKYVVVTAEDGGILNDPVLLRPAEDRFWLALADSDLLLWAKGVAVGSGFDVEIREPDVSPVQVQGPKSKDVVRALFGDGILELPYYHCVETELDGIPVVVGRTGWTGEVGYEIYLCDSSRGDDLWERVMSAGRPYEIRPIAPSQIRRIEAGIFNYGSDMRADNNPFEVTGLERLVDLDKEAGYIGKEALLRIHAEGVRRKLVGVELSGPPIETWPQEFWPVYRLGDRVGHLTDAVHSPRLEANIGYAWVPVELAPLGTELEIETPSGVRGARVAALPFFDPRKSLPKS
jgi:aminomethyltransferase